MKVSTFLWSYLIAFAVVIAVLWHLMTIDA
jgi:hypothetical protein